MTDTELTLRYMQEKARGERLAALLRAHHAAGVLDGVNVGDDCPICATDKHESLVNPMNERIVLDLPAWAARGLYDHIGTMPYAAGSWSSFIRWELNHSGSFAEVFGETTETIEALQRMGSGVYFTDARVPAEDSSTRYVVELIGESEWYATEYRDGDARSGSGPLGTPEEALARVRSLAAPFPKPNLETHGLPSVEDLKAYNERWTFAADPQTEHQRSIGLRTYFGRKHPRAAELCGRCTAERLGSCGDGRGYPACMERDES